MDFAPEHESLPEPAQRDRRRVNWVILLGGIALGAILLHQLVGGARDGGSAALATLDRANRELLTKMGWGVRAADDLEWLTRLGRGDSKAWEFTVARDGTLDLELEFAPQSNAVIRTPVLSGQRVYFAFRPRLGESGLVLYHVPRNGFQAVGEGSWGADSAHWGACVSVLAPGAGARVIEVETKGGETVSWERTEGQYDSQVRPYFGSPLGGIDLEGTPMGPIAVPASARITGIAIAALPTGRVIMAPSSMGAPGEIPSAGEGVALVGMSFPGRPEASIQLLELVWSTRTSSTSTPAPIATWIVRASLRAAGTATGGR